MEKRTESLIRMGSDMRSELAHDHTKWRKSIYMHDVTRGFELLNKQPVVFARLFHLIFILVVEIEVHRIRTYGFICHFSYSLVF